MKRQNKWKHKDCCLDLGFNSWSHFLCSENLSELRVISLVLGTLMDPIRSMELVFLCSSCLFPPHFSIVPDKCHSPIPTISITRLLQDCPRHWGSKCKQRDSVYAFMDLMVSSQKRPEYLIQPYAHSHGKAQLPHFSPGTYCYPHWSVCSSLLPNHA